MSVKKIKKKERSHATEQHSGTQQTLKMHKHTPSSAIADCIDSIQILKSLLSIASRTLKLFMKGSIWNLSNQAVDGWHVELEAGIIEGLGLYHRYTFGA